MDYTIEMAVRGKSTNQVMEKSGSLHWMRRTKCSKNKLKENRDNNLVAK